MPVFLTNKKKKNITYGRVKHKSLFAQLVLFLLSMELLFFSGFTALCLPTATGKNLQLYLLKNGAKLYNKFSRKFKMACQNAVPDMIPPDPHSLPPVRYSMYVPQAPAAIFLGYVLGWPLALFALLGYFILGLIGPVFKLYVFAAGSGLSYYLQPGFGYLIGMIVAGACVGWFSKGERKSLNQLLSLCIGLLCVHGVGLTYLLAICLFGAINDTVGQQLVWSNWLFEEVRNLTWYALPYDALFSLGLIGIAFPFRWLAQILTAPDISAIEGDNDKLIDFKLAK